MDWNGIYTIQISCFSGLAPYLATEAEALGYKVQSTRLTGVQVTGTIRDAMKLNLKLRTALNVLVLLKKVRARSADELYKEASKIRWELMIPPDEYLSVVGRVNTRAIRNSMFANQRLKDAIVDRIMAHAGRRPNSGPDKSRAVVNLFWNNDDAWIYLNTSGMKLADRGYRHMPHKAPLRETLAAGILMAADYDGTKPLVCPMCGSGTLAIEAALMSLNRAPAILRDNFGFMHLVDYKPEPWAEMRTQARAEGYRKLRTPIIASDIDADAIFAAEKNAKVAGVDHLIDFHVCDFAETPMPETPGIIVLNPEYGERMGEVKALEAIYKRIGDFFKQSCPGWTGYVFTGNPDLGKKVGLRPARKLQFWNAKIECRLLEFALYAGSKRAKEQGK
jgi:23S rRNA (guanine2445-N2)-methyltransferase